MMALENVNSFLKFKRGCRYNYYQNTQKFDLLTFYRGYIIIGKDVIDSNYYFERGAIDENCCNL